jgi:hypothetical protein
MRTVTRTRPFLSTFARHIVTPRSGDTVVVPRQASDGQRHVELPMDFKARSGHAKRNRLFWTKPFVSFKLDNRPKAKRRENYFVTPVRRIRTRGYCRQSSGPHASTNGFTTRF